MVAPPSVNVSAFPSGFRWSAAAAAFQTIADAERISYLAGQIAAVGEAIEAGVDIREYTAWSLLDNFEWAEGFTQRFGLVHVDMETGERMPKESFEWYCGLIGEARA